MSEIKVNSIKGVAASTAALTINNTDGTCTANLTNRTNKNLIINGSHIIAQRGTSGNIGAFVIDRFPVFGEGHDEIPTQAQVDVASGTTPYTLGFRKALKITNGNQTSGAGANDRLFTQTKLEAQDIANSGWNYKSSSSFITLSFWVKSSVAQNFFGDIRTFDGTAQGYAFETGSLTADTWTKITKTIPGNSNLQFDNNNKNGLAILFGVYHGTGFTDAGVTLNQWGTYNGSQRQPTNTTTWYTTDNATFEYTGVQLEVGSVATDFEHRSFANELARCQRYYYRYQQDASSSSAYWVGHVTAYGNNNNMVIFYFPVSMREYPASLDTSGTNSDYQLWGNNTVENLGSTPTLRSSHGLNHQTAAVDISHGISTGDSRVLRIAGSTGAYFGFSAEL